MLGNYRFERFNNSYLITNDSGNFAFLTEKEFEQFRQDSIPKDSELWFELKDKFFCYDGDTEVYLRNVQESIRNNRAYLFSPTSLFIIALTNRCNNRCVYCQAKGCSNPLDMNSDTASKIIERIAESNLKNICIEFQGGEPLLNFPIIRVIIDSAHKLLAGRQVEFSLVSNLACINDEIANYIADNRISVSTSLDGPQKLHDLNRPNESKHSSFELMMQGMKLLKDRNVPVAAIQTTTRSSLGYAKEIVHTYQSLGMNSLFLRPLTRLGIAATSWDQIGYTPEEFIRFYREALEEIIRIDTLGTFFYEAHASLFLSKLFGAKAQNYMELRSPCGAGLGQMAFTANGDVFTCDEGRMVAEMGDNFFRLGNVYQNGYNDWIESITCKAVCASSLLETIPTCCDCVYQSYCGVCPVINYVMEGSLKPKTPHNDRCKIYHGILDTLMQYIQKNEQDIINIFKKWVHYIA